MAERFERLYKLSENLYIDGAPIIISAGALLKDTATGSVVAQIKFHSVSENIIKAIKISLCAYDVSGAEIEGVRDYQYLDLSICNGQEFGANKAIVLPSAVTRSFSILDITVVFSNNSQWKLEDVAKLKQLPTPKHLSAEFHNAEIEKQYKISTIASAMYVPSETMSIWSCTCGEWNVASKCTQCGSARKTVFSALNIDVLQIDANKRIAAEQAQQEEASRIAAETEKRRQELKAEKKIAAKKRNKIIAITLACVAIIFIAVYVVRNMVIPTITYNDAIALISQEKYTEAYYKLHKCKGYKDITDLLDNFTIVYEQSTYTSADGKTNVTDYIYDEAGRCISEKTLNSSGGVSSFEFQYDEVGNLAKETETMSDGRVFITVFSYGNYGCIKEEHSSLHQDYKYTKEYVYDNTGKCIKEITTNSDGDTDTVDYQYDSAGNLLKAYYSRSWGGDAFIEYFYDSKGLCVEERHWFAQDETPYETVEYVRNESGEWISRVSKDRGGNIEKTMENHYDDYGNRYMYTITNSDGDKDTNEYSGLLIFYNNH